MLRGQLKTFSKVREALCYHAPVLSFCHVLNLNTCFKEVRFLILIGVQAQEAIRKVMQRPTPHQKYGNHISRVLQTTSK